VAFAPPVDILQPDNDGECPEARYARRRSYADPIAAAQAAGLRELALRLARELRELLALAERIAVDDVYRAELDADPVATLVAAVMPAATAEPLLQVLAVADDVLAKLPEVVARQHEQPPCKARLFIISSEAPRSSRRFALQPVALSDGCALVQRERWAGRPLLRLANSPRADRRAAHVAATAMSTEGASEPLRPSQ